MRREVECSPTRQFPNRKSSMQEAQRCSTRAVPRPRQSPSGRCTFMLVTSLLTFRQRHPVRAVMQRTHATQLSNFDNALLCSAFKFLLYHCSLSAFLHFFRSDHDWKVIQIMRSRCTFTVTSFLMSKIVWRQWRAFACISFYNYVPLFLKHHKTVGTYWVHQLPTYSKLK